MPRIDPTPVTGGGVIYRRKEDGPFQLYLYVKSEKIKLRQSLDTSDKTEAIRRAEAICLDTLVKERAGHKIGQTTLGDVIREWHRIQLERLKRGELRSPRKIEAVHSFFIKKLGSWAGLNTPTVDLTDERWTTYIDWRSSNSTVKLSTIQEEMKQIRSLCKHPGRKYGLIMPTFSIRLPVQERAIRTEVFTSEEIRCLIEALDAYCEPDEDGRYKRDWTMVGRAPGSKTGKPDRIDQDMERDRRLMLKWYVRVLLATGARPGEIAGDERASIRWMDVEVKEERVVAESMSRRTPTAKRIAMISIRPDTKTGERKVPAPCAKQLEELREHSKFTDPTDYVFAEQNGVRAGQPIALDALRLHWREVLRRMEFTRFDATFYHLRHYKASEMLKTGANLFLTAKLLGHDPQVLTKVYAKAVMESEEVLEQLYKEKLVQEMDGGEF